MATLYVVKLGGAALTDKAAYRELRAWPLAALAGAVGAAAASIAATCPSSALVLIHGAGSFGHLEARVHGLNAAHPADGQQSPLGVALCRASLALLHAAVLDALVRVGVPAATVPVFPHGGEERGGGGGGGARGYVAAAAALLDEGFVPVLHGDPVLLSPPPPPPPLAPPADGRRGRGGGSSCEPPRQPPRQPPHGSPPTTSDAAARTSVVSGDEVAAVLAARLCASPAARLLCAGRVGCDGGGGGQEGGGEGGAGGGGGGDKGGGVPATSQLPRYPRGVRVVFVTGAPGAFTRAPVLPGEAAADGGPPPRLISRVVVHASGEETVVLEGEEGDDDEDGEGEGNEGEGVLAAGDRKSVV